MAVSEQTTALIAVFRDRARAQRYLDELKRHGFPDEEIGMLSPGDTLPRAAGDDEGAAAAITGGAIGAFAGALATGLIPGAGPVVAAGLMAGMLGGAAVGGVVGTLISLGVPEEEAQRYEREFQAGRTLVVVQSIGRGGEAMSILRECERMG